MMIALVWGSRQGLIITSLSRKEEAMFDSRIMKQVLLGVLMLTLINGTQLVPGSTLSKAIRFVTGEIRGAVTKVVNFVSEISLAE